MSETIRYDSIGHDDEYHPYSDATRVPAPGPASTSMFIYDFSSRAEAPFDEATLLRNRFESFAEQAKVDLSDPSPKSRLQIAETMVDFIFSVVDKGEDEAPDELALGLHGVAHAQKHVIQRKVKQFYDEYRIGGADKFLNQKREAFIEKYIVLADTVNAGMHYTDLALLQRLRDTLEGQNHQVATEVYAAYGKHYESFYGRHFPGSSQIGRLAIGNMHPTPETRRVVNDFGHINDED